MAEYVTRNGAEFEELVASQKGSDPRFGFLKKDHPLHPFYLSRRQFHDPDYRSSPTIDNASARKQPTDDPTTRVQVDNDDDVDKGGKSGDVV